MKAGRARIANASRWILEAAELCLFVNDSNMSDDPFAYEEAKGYVPVRFSNVGWRWDEDSNPMIGAYEPIHMRIGAAQDVYGYFIRGADGSVIHAEKFAKKFEALPGDSVMIHPRLIIKVPNGNNL